MSMRPWEECLMDMSMVHWISTVIASLEIPRKKKSIYQRMTHSDFLTVLSVKQTSDSWN
jgi:hypothetical protein